jgi:hypothetical protein
MTREPKPALLRQAALAIEAALLPATTLRQEPVSGQPLADARQALSSLEARRSAARPGQPTPLAPMA